MHGTLQHPTALLQILSSFSCDDETSECNITASEMYEKFDIKKKIMKELHNILNFFLYICNES